MIDVPSSQSEPADFLPSARSDGRQETPSSRSRGRENAEISYLHSPLVILADLPASAAAAAAGEEQTSNNQHHILNSKIEVYLFLSGA